MYALFATLRKKVEPKRLHPGAVLENGATSEGGAVFFSLNFLDKNSSTFEGGTKMVPGVVLKQCHPDQNGAVFNLFFLKKRLHPPRWHRFPKRLQGGAILAPLFFSVL